MPRNRRATALMVVAHNYNYAGGAAPDREWSGRTDETPILCLSQGPIRREVTCMGVAYFKCEDLHVLASTYT